MAPPQLKHNLPPHFTVILLGTGAWLTSQVGIHAIFIRVKIHWTTTHSLRIYLKKNNNKINKSHHLIKARQASQLFKSACVGFVAAFLAGNQMSWEELLSYLIMYGGPQGIRQQNSGAVNAPPCCPVWAVQYEPKLSTHFYTFGTRMLFATGKCIQISYSSKTEITHWKNT